MFTVHVSYDTQHNMIKDTIWHAIQKKKKMTNTYKDFPACKCIKNCEKANIVMGGKSNKITNIKVSGQ